ncbi:MAG: hypothetical protein KIS66_09740 [Fimbriimonadaceae bacterium]|nr:hypothetical protein [Fimbriimonadaceae bacterium]
MSATVAPALSPIVAQAVSFTAAFREFEDAPTPIREAMCLRAQYPARMGDLRPGDSFAGRMASGRLAYVGTIWWAAPPRTDRGEYAPCKQGGFCFGFGLAARLAEDPIQREAVEELAAFWRDRCTWSRFERSLASDVRGAVAQEGMVPSGSNGFCVAVNVDRLIRLGLPGLRAEVAGRRRTGADPAFYEGLLLALDVVEEVVRHHRDQARDMAERDAAFHPVAETLQQNLERAPATFREALQLFWLYTHLVSGHHPEAHRLDQALGDLYARDVDSGRLSEEEAVGLLVALWRMFSENGADALCRIVIGGMGRRNEANADRFALAAMEATRRHRGVTPQLTLRCYEGLNPKLLEKAFDCIAEGCCYPMLYNDEAIIPGVMRSMHLDEAAASHYYPLGCGEYMVGWAGPSVLCCGWNLGKTLDAALHQGRSSGLAIGPPTPSVEAMPTFEDLYAALMVHVRFAADATARYYATVFETVPKETPFLLASLLTDGCLERGKGILEGADHLGACVMGHGLTNVADALAAIRRVVYQKGLCPLGELVRALDADFEGYADLRAALLAAPKFGNDEDEVDELLVRLWDDINEAADDAGRRAGLGFFTVSSVNPGGYAMGEACPATADGRRAGRPFAIGHAPTAGMDRNGITALLNSVAKAGPANGGATTNVKVSREMFAHARPKVEAVFDAYFAAGGQEATITVVSRNDLEEAMREPERFPHLLVRLGGWCARFVELSRDVQEEIVRRTLY